MDKRHFLLLNVGHFLDHFFLLIFATAAVLSLTNEWQLSYAQLIPYSTAGFIAFGLFSLPSGWLADKWSREGMMFVFFIGIGLSSIGTSTAKSPIEIAFWLFLIGIFASIYHPVGIPMVMRVAGSKSGKMLGINGIFGSYGMAMASGVAALMIWLVSWRMAYIVPGALSIILGIWFAVRFRDQTNETRAARLLTAQSEARKEGLGDMIRELGLSRFLQIMGALSLMTLGAGLVFQCMTIGLPKILQARVDFVTDAEGAGFVASAIFFVGALAQLAGGLLADKFPLKWLFICIYGLMTPALFLAAVSTDYVMIVAIWMIVMITVGNQPVSDFLFSRYVPKRWVNTAFGFRFALSLGTAIVAVPLVGEVFDQTGDFYYAFLAMAAAAAIAVLSALILPNRGIEAPTTSTSPQPELSKT